MSNLLSQASLVMIPSGYKEDVVYSQIPTNGAGDLSFTRASNGTRINSAGLVEVTPWNIFQQSEDFSNAAWTKTNTTVTSNSITAPNGTLTADLIVPANATDGVIVQASLSFIVGTSYSLSVYGKKEDFNFLLLALPSAAFPTSNRVALFDLNNGTIASSTQSGTGAVITDVGNGWYRCSIAITATATTSANVVIAARSSNNLTSLGNGTDGIYIWGAQLNTGELKPYFPTTDRLNVPRLTYQNGGGGCPSLLLEKQSTNLFTYSEDFTNSIWNKTRSTITANATTSPDGTQNADTYVDGTYTNNYSYIDSLFTASGVATTFSIFVKKGTANYVVIGIYDGASNNIVVDTNTWTISTTIGSFTTTKIESYGNGWYRLSVTKTLSGFCYPNFSVSNNSTWATYNGNGTLTAYYWGAQIEASSYSTSYIQTTSSSATRVADACFKTGISSLIGQTEGTIFLDLVWNSPIGDVVPLDIVGSDGKLIWMRGIGAQFYGNGTTLIANIGVSGAVQGTRYKIAFVYGANDFKLYRNGVLVGTDTSGTFTGSFSDLALNSVINQSNLFNQVVLFKTKLTDAELIALTS